jgi:hypothetical protein
VRLLDAQDGDGGNAVVVAGSVKALKPPRLMMRPMLGARELARDLGALDFRPLRT